MLDRKKERKCIEFLFRIKEESIKTVVYQASCYFSFSQQTYLWHYTMAIFFFHLFYMKTWFFFSLTFLFQMLPFYSYSKQKILQVFRLPIYLIMSHLLESTMVDNRSKGIFFLLMHDRHVSYGRVVCLILH